MSRFLDAANRRPVDTTPIWLMREAGRSLPEYRKLRERWKLANIVAQPEPCADVERLRVVTGEEVAPR